MMGVLADKFNKAREGRVAVKGHTFIYLRPTWEEAQRIPGPSAGERLLSHVIGWDGVNEIDLIPGGDPPPVPFDAEACRLWLSDRPDLAGEVAESIMKSYAAHLERLGAALKN
jgi:hypothetical protein